MEETTEDSRYQVICANICWSNKSKSGQVKKDNRAELPNQMSIDIPNAVLVQADKKQNNFNDIIETFCYNLLTKKYGREVTYCQIWLPLED